MKIAPGLAYGVAALLTVSSPATAETSETQPAKSPSEKADALLGGLIRTNDPGVAVLVAQDGRILFEKGYGLADMEHHVPITPQTTFRIGSITKQFTASAILKLEEEGKLSVNDRLSKYIPDFPRGGEVTLRHLLTHTSGIHSYTDELEFDSRATHATTTDAIIEAMKKYPYDFDPGVKWHYDNSGYVLLGYIVGKVSGQGYGDFLRQNFFQPLGMTNTGVYRAQLGLPHEALGYSLGTNGFKRALNWDMSWADGAGALYSTVEDLYRWNEGIFNGRVLDVASLKSAFTRAETKESEAYYNSNDDGYGFGWFISRHRGLREIWHGGDLPGFRSMLVRVPDEKFTVSILANAWPGQRNTDPAILVYQLVDIFLADQFAPLPTTANTNVSPKSYDALTGRYNLVGIGKIVIISRRGTHLFAQYADQPPAGEIFPESDTEFFLKGMDTQITFLKDRSGKVVKLIFNYKGYDLEAPRVEDIAEAEVDPAIYDSLVGKYDYGKYGVLMVTREGNHLFAQLIGQPKQEIFPKSETEYFRKDVDAQINFVKDAAGKVTKSIYHQDGQTLEAPKIQ